MSSDIELLREDNDNMTAVSNPAPQVVYLDFDGAEASYFNEALGLSIEDITVSSSGFDTTVISLIVADLNRMFGDDIVFTAELPVSATYSTIYIGTTDAFDSYGSFLGIAETIDSGNKIHDDNAFVLLDAASSAEFVTSVIAHETEHIVHGMDHGGEGLTRYASDYVVSSGRSSATMAIGPGTDTLLVQSGGVVSKATVNTSAVMTVDNGGVVSSAIVNFNGITSVNSGGVVSNAALSNGSMFVGGNVGSVFNNFGTLVVNNGGEVQNVTISAGGLTISGGGTVVSTDLISGVVHVNGGTASSITMHNGTVMIYSGGVASSLVVSGGTLTVYSGASATDIAWTPFLQGKVNIQSGGYATFANSGYYLGSGNTPQGSGMSISEIVVGNGSLYVFENGLVENATVEVVGLPPSATLFPDTTPSRSAGGTLTV